MTRHLLSILSALLATLTLGACSDANDKNQLAVYLCDSPADYSAVYCYVENVELRAADTDTWTPMPLTETYFPLMELVNGKMREAARSTLSEGASYDAVRITFSQENASVAVSGELYELAVDAADATVTVPIPTLTMTGPNTPLLFDIDIASSVVEDPATTYGYRFRPRITYIDTQTFGVVQGGMQVGDEAVSQRMWLRFTNNTNGETASTYCSLDPAGAFFMRLAPGDYTLEVVPADGTNITPYSTTLTVTAQQVTDLGTILLESTATTL